MDADTTIKVSGGVVASVLGWFLNQLRLDYRGFKKSVWRRFKEVDDEMAEHAILDVQTFVTKPEFNLLRTDINQGFAEMRKLVIDLAHKK